MVLKLNRETGKTVVTGQQIGLLGGPLYTTYKVLGAIYLAQQLKGQAVYWLETNDADFNEINHIDYLDAQGQLKTLTWDIDSQGFSCGLIPVDESLTALLEQFFSDLRQTEFTPQLKEMVMDCYGPGRTLGEASMALASALLGDFPLYLFDPSKPEFREFSRKILLKEAQKTVEGEQCNLFCMMGNQRKALFRKGHGFCLRDNTPVELESYDLVPNVKTRNLCQDAYFDTHTYIAGPGEMKYIAQLDDQYQWHGITKSALQPRMSISLLEPRVKRLLEKASLTLEQVLEMSKEDLVKYVLSAHSEGDFDPSGALQSGMEMTESYLTQLQALGIDTADIKSLRKLLRPEIKKVFGNLRAREKEKYSRLLADTRYLSDNLKPFGKPQERVFNIFYYMNLYGGKRFISFLYEHYQWQRRQLDVVSLPQNN